MALEFLQATLDAVDRTIYNFAGQNLSAAASGRHIIVDVSARRANTTATTIVSVTVGGVAATIVVQRNDSVGGGRNIKGLAIAAVPTGTSGDIVVTLSGACARAAIGVWRADDLPSATPTATASNFQSTNTPAAVALDVPSGFALAGGMALAPSAAWSGLTEQYDTVVESNTAVTGAWQEFIGPETGRAISVNFAVVGQQMVAASWAYNAAAAPAFSRGLIFG